MTISEAYKQICERVEKRLDINFQDDEIIREMLNDEFPTPFLPRLVADLPKKYDPIKLSTQDADMEKWLDDFAGVVAAHCKEFHANFTPEQNLTQLTGGFLKHFMTDYLTLVVMMYQSVQPGEN